MSHQSLVACSSLLLFAVLPSVGFAQQAALATPSYSSKAVQVSPLSGDDKRELVLNAVSILPGGAIPMHIHSGDCVGSVIEGTVELLIDGQPPRRVSVGEAYSNMRGSVHSFRNVGDGPARLLNNLVVDKGVPRTQMIPAAVRP